MIKTANNFISYHLLQTKKMLCVAMKLSYQTYIWLFYSCFNLTADSLVYISINKNMHTPINLQYQSVQIQSLNVVKRMSKPLN